MILNVNKIETAVLLLHVTLMRKNVKKGFKKDESGNEILNSFDELKNALEANMELVEDKDDTYTTELHFNIREIKTLQSFLSWYIDKLENTLKQAGKITQEDQKQIECLRNINEKANSVLVA